jgi:hypothetical protein
VVAGTTALGAVLVDHFVGVGAVLDGRRVVDPADPAEDTPRASTKQMDTEAMPISEPPRGSFLPMPG